MENKTYVVLSEDDIVKEPERRKDWEDNKYYRVSIHKIPNQDAKDFLEGKIDKSELMDIAYDNWEDGFYEVSFDEAGKVAVQACKEKGYEILMRIYLDEKTNTCIKRIY